MGQSAPGVRTHWLRIAHPVPLAQYEEREAKRRKARARKRQV